MNMTATAYLKRSQFAVGLARALRGLTGDMHVLLWLGKRKLQIRKYVKLHQAKRLHLGASNNALDGWLNTDIFPNHSSIVYLDATKRFPFKDNTFDYILSEHMIEHVEYQAAIAMLRESFRTLKPGGRVRVATPDLRVLLALHSAEKTVAQRNYIDWASARFTPGVVECKDVFVINNFFRAWGHCFIYDSDALSHALLATGFCDIKSYKPGDSDDPNLKNLESHGKELGAEDINQFETMVIEGRKKIEPDRAFDAHPTTGQNE